MENIKGRSVAVLGFLILASGLLLWVLGDRTTTLVTLPLASTGVLWAPLLWLMGIIIVLSSALAGVLRFKNYLMWILVLLVGYLGIFGAIVLVVSRLLPA